jgi:hypothetical protein
VILTDCDSILEWKSVVFNSVFELPWISCEIGIRTEMAGV